MLMTVDKANIHDHPNHDAEHDADGDDGVSVAFAVATQKP